MTSILLGLETKQVDYVATFVRAGIDTTVYIEMPKGFAQPGIVLKLKKSLYGLKQSPRNHFNNLSSKLTTLGFESCEQSDTFASHVQLYSCKSIMGSPKSGEDVLLKTELKSLQYWQSDGAAWPDLQKIGVKLFTLATSSASSERIFSTMGLVHIKLRNSLSTETVEKLV
jgi:hypothetical protein